MTEVGRMLFALFGVGCIIALTRLAWELAGGLGHALIHRYWQHRERSISAQYGHDAQGRAYRWFVNDLGYVCFVERVAEYDKSVDAE